MRVIKTDVSDLISMYAAHCSLAITRIFVLRIRSTVSVLINYHDQELDNI